MLSACTVNEGDQVQRGNHVGHEYLTSHVPTPSDHCTTTSSTSAVAGRCNQDVVAQFRWSDTANEHGDGLEQEKPGNDQVGQDEIAERTGRPVRRQMPQMRSQQQLDECHHECRPRRATQRRCLRY